MMSIMFLGFAEIAQAVRPVAPRMVTSHEPFVKLSVKPDRLVLGIVPSIGRSSNSQAKLDAHIVANCPFQIKASFTPFKRTRDYSSIQSSHISAEINGTNVGISGKAVPIIKSMKPTPAGGVDIPLDIKLSLANSTMYPAGSYKGDLVFSIMAASY